ncbi:Mediator of RNA polymerase II transcription subunit 15a [Quillaja saponaria]|uniref:Mediator of RNA polymerase II transcription subunit 15a n=1 Tax=Quillaja saponaria TaxID=32244 RepID=A0AAD7PNZ1_QUISA|nr:Mediator of RNA polymerase II transcription subunit 15a [Quillaja saponaria]
MENNNWQPAQGGEPTLDTGDWRTGLQPDSRQRIVNKIMETLKRHLPVSGQEGIHELQKIAQRFEEKIYTAATSQSDYLRKISLKMLTMESKSQPNTANPLPSNSGGNSSNLPDPGLGMQSQVHNQGQSLPIPLANQSHSRQQLLPQNIQNSMTSAGVQNSAGLPSRMQSLSGLTQTPIPNVAQNSDMQNMAGASQNIGTSMGQGPSMTQSSSLPSIQPNQQFNNVQQSTQSMLQQHPQSVLRQQQQSQQNAVVHQNQTPGYQQSMLLPQQQSNATTMLQIGQQSSVGDMQQQQRLLGQQNNLANMHQHQHQQQHQQQLLNLQNNPSNIHQQQLGSNVTGLQQQQQQHLLGTQSGNSSIQTNKHSVHMLQQANVSMQQQNASNLLPSQGQQVQPQSQQQQLMPRIQSHSAQLQQQLSLQQQPNPLQRDMQQRIQGSGSSPLLQQQNVLDQQKQLYLSQRALPETSPTSLDSTAQTGQINGGDWQEEVFQKINTMKETYIQELNDMHGKIVSKLGQQDSLPQQTNKDQLEKLRIFKAMLERIIAFLQQGQLPPSHMHSKLQPQSQVTQVQSHENQMNSQLQATNLQGSVASTQNSNTMTNLQHIPMSSIAGVSTLQQNMRNSLLPGANMGSGQGNGMNSLQQGTGVKLGTFPQHLSSSQRSMKSGAQFPVSSPQLLQAVSPQIPQHSSPQVDQQNLLPSLTKVGTPLQSTNSPFVVPTSSPPLAPSPMPGDFEKPISGASALTNAGTIAHQQTGGGVAPTPSLAIGTPGISASPLLAEFTGPDGAHGNALTAAPGKSSVTEQPIERLIRAVKSMSHKALTASVTDIGSIVMLTDRIAGSAPGNGSRAAIGEDLAAMTKCRLLARNIMTQDGTDGSKKMRHYTSFMPLNVVSSARSLIGSETSDLDTTATSIINSLIIQTLKQQYHSGQMSQIQPLRLLVPTNYPNCSPVFLDRLPDESSNNGDLSAKTRSKFSAALRSLSHPMSLEEIVRAWDASARAVICEYAQQRGGGTFSSSFGSWRTL